MKPTDRQRWYLNILTVILAVVIVVAAVIYLGFQLSACQQYTTITSSYTADAPCTCTTAVGSFQEYAQVMVRNTSFASQCESVNVASGIVVWQGLSLAPFGLYEYLDGYFKAEFSTVLVHNRTINVFELYNPDNLPTADFTRYSDLPYLYSCIIYGVPNGTQYTPHDCIQRLSELRPNAPIFDPMLALGYQDNAVYRDLCELQSCAIQQCTSLAVLAILLQACSLIGAILLMYRFARYVIIHWIVSAPTKEMGVDPTKMESLV